MRDSREKVAGMREQDPPLPDPVSCHSITERSFDKGRQPSATMKQQEALKVLRDSVVSKPELLLMKV